MTRGHPGRLIVLEGGEGAGKTTHAAFVRDWLRRRGRTVVLTREPGGTPLAEAARRLVLRQWAGGITPLTELLLMFAARADHLDRRIRPALAKGHDVVCDRFVDASYAYQGAGRGCRERDIRALERMTVGRLRPQLVILLDIPPESGARRTRARGTENRFDQEQRAFRLRVRRAYLARARAAPSRYVVVRAGRDLQSVRRAIENALEQQL